MAQNFNMEEYANKEKPKVIAVSSGLVKTYQDTLTDSQLWFILLVPFLLTHNSPTVGLLVSSTPATYYYLKPEIQRRERY